MNQKELRELIEFLKANDIAEFELERGDVKVKVKWAGEHPPPSAPDIRFVHASAPQAVPAAAVAPAAAPVVAPPPEPKVEAEDLFIVKSPIVGTFYEAPSPGAPPFVGAGDEVKAGQVLCIIEAMKLMNEIESEVAGEVVKRLVSNGQPVEYGQPLFAIRQQK
ncbi:MAG: acetyl-CoA carboxylase biotin carboxyl carrier protein [Acidobacteriales bacterium]|nr:acetyl-CoA carboxylase biotin carboxyl carrier protein [Terriglobales bacterium]